MNFVTERLIDAANRQFQEVDVELEKQKQRLTYFILNLHRNPCGVLVIEVPKDKGLIDWAVEEQGLRFRETESRFMTFFGWKVNPRSEYKKWTVSARQWNTVLEMQAEERKRRRSFATPANSSGTIPL